MPGGQPGVPLAPSVVAVIRELRKVGHSAPDIAKRLGVSTGSVYSHCSEKRRDACPYCGAPKAITSGLCRRCANTQLSNPALRPEFRQYPQSLQDGRTGRSEAQGDVNHDGAPTGGSAAPLEAAGGVVDYWRCAESPSGAHHWELDQACKGVCRYCRGDRQFKQRILQDFHEGPAKPS